MNWEDAYHTEALKAREAAARVDALISELGMTPLPLLTRKRTAPSPETASVTLPFCCMRRWTC